eukprot:s4228_g3.t1
MVVLAHTTEEAEWNVLWHVPVEEHRVDGVKDFLLKLYLSEVSAPQTLSYEQTYFSVFISSCFRDRRRDDSDAGCSRLRVRLVSFNLAANYSETPPLKPYGSVCHAEKWQNYTKTYELVGAGFCRPEGCDPEDPNCRVNGYYGNGASLLDCRRRCEVEANCIGFSFLPSDGIDQVNSGCFVHTNGSYVPPNWISYARDYKSIGGASFTSSALCYRIVPTDPSRPTTRGCYFKQSTAGNGRCGGPHTTWVSDDWGRQNEWSWEDEARCFQRKTDLDNYCESNTTMLFVHDSANEAFGSPSPRAVAERLTWLTTKELLLSFELPRCETVPFQQRDQGGNARRESPRGGGRRGNARRLQKQADFMRDSLGSRKVLVAPYKGEVKELLDMVTVEALLSAVEDSTSGTKKSIIEGFSGLLLQCPLVRGLTARNAFQLLEDHFLFMDSAEEVQDFARRQGDDVLLAIVFNSADSEGNFPGDSLDLDFSIRAHAQLLPTTSRIIRQSRSGGFFGFKEFYWYPYIDLAFAQMEEVVGLAAARLQARREARLNRTTSGHFEKLNHISSQALFQDHRKRDKRQTANIDNGWRSAMDHGICAMDGAAKGWVQPFGLRALF